MNYFATAQCVGIKTPGGLAERGQDVGRDQRARENLRC